MEHVNDIVGRFYLSKLMNALRQTQIVEVPATKKLYYELDKALKA